jgi:hypothetical protein
MAVTVIAEARPDCGQSGRVGRVFWRAGAPWILMHADDGRTLTVPWDATNLPMLVAGAASAEESAPLLLSPAALLALARFLQERSVPTHTPERLLRRKG